MTTAIRNRAASMRALLNAGIEAFSEKGYDGATTKDIARRAGLNEQLITRYFGGKTGLLMAIYQDFVARQEDDQAYQNAERQESVTAEVLSFLLLKHKHFQSNRELMTIVLTKILTDPEARSKLEYDVIYRTRQVLAERLTIFQQEGAIRSDCNVERFSETVMAHSFMQSYLTPMIFGLKYDSEEYLRQFATDVCEGILHER